MRTRTVPRVPKSTPTLPEPKSTDSASIAFCWRTGPARFKSVVKIMTNSSPTTRYLLEPIYFMSFTTVFFMLFGFSRVIIAP